MVVTAPAIHVSPSLKETLRAPVLLRPKSTTALRDQLLKHFDRSGDGQITVDDFTRSRTSSALIQDSSGAPALLTGPEQISRAAAIAAERVRGGISSFAIEDLTPARTNALREEIGKNWGRLVRSSASVEDLVYALEQKQVEPADGVYRIYAPADDAEAVKTLSAQVVAFNQSHLRKVQLSTLRMDGAKTWDELNQHVGLAYLPKTYPVPGGQFNEMYNWDSVFIAQALLRTGAAHDVDLAHNVAENFAYAIEHYGKIPNSNFSYLMSRTQPPLMARLALELETVRPDPVFLRRMGEAGLKELDSVWRSGHRLTPSGLSRYHDDATGPLSEIRKDLYEYFPDDPEFHLHQRSIRESGHDDTHQFGLEAHHYEPVELNSLLYRYERDLAKVWVRIEGEQSPTASRLNADAARRAGTMQRRFWDEEAGMFFDYNFARDQRSDYLALSGFFPLADGWATPEQAASVAANVSHFLEAGGLATSARSSRDAAGGESFQWDHPVGWGPLQQVAVEGLRKYGYDALADEVSYRWLSMVLKIAGERNGLMKEKYDVVEASPWVELEYGNQGGGRGRLDADEASPLGFGWTNSTFVRMLDGLSPALRAKLDEDVAPDEIFSPVRGPPGLSARAPSPQTAPAL